MITNISPIIPQDNQEAIAQDNPQAIAQDNQEANPQQNFDKIRNPILKDIANNLGNNDRRQGYLSDLSDPESEVFKSFLSAILETNGDENEQVVDLYHTLNHNKMLNGHSFKNFILMDKNIKKYILDENINNQRQLFKRGVQSALVTVGFALGLTYIGAPCATGCAAGVVAGTSINVVKQAGRYIDQISLIDKYENFKELVADTQPTYQNPDLPLVRDYLHIQGGTGALLDFLSRSTTPAVRLGSRWSNPSIEPSQQNSMFESGQPNPSPATIENRLPNRLPISSLQAIGDAISRSNTSLS